VYMYAAQGDRVSVKLASNTSDTTSAKTLGLCAENIAAGQAGMVLCQGVQDGLNLAAYNPGDTLYLGATAGTLTSTKPYAPNHLVYIGVVERANAGNGRLYVRVQNGYELDELHNVSAQSPSNGQTLIYNATTGLWTKGTLTAGTGISIANGAGSITVTNSAPDQTVALTAGTGISTSGTYPNFTITNSAPDQTVSLTGAGTTSISGTYPSFTITSNDQYVGTVTSVGGTGTVNGISLSGTVTSSGNLTLGGTLSGVDLTTQVTGTLPIANGGTGQTTANAAFNALAPSQTSNSGKYLTTDGTNTSWATVNAGASLSNDTSTSTNLYPLFAAATSGTPTTLYTSNAQYLFKPSTGELSVKAPRASNGILVNSQTISADYTIASGDNGGSFGPVSVASGITVTVSSGSVWTVV